ncbi:hypothetical protein HU200_001299 [Digitaria exilis]|uniref:Late embryogenesis abundant protein LEA-2 subgroup domain-containing protein n=1 Tax=Digitaria exilis TaxID=1010633 RepID=A0A835FXG0_9POAL|nr:hypothetical protein HU200_001299 [Digitaria exilis]
MARRPLRNYKCYTLWVLAACLAVSAAVSIVLALTRPAHINYTITSVTRRNSRNTSIDGDNGGRLRLSFTLTTNNTSPSSVLYRSFYVLVCSSSSSSACIATDVTPLLPRQEPRSLKRIDWAVELGGAGSPWVTLGVMPSMEAFDRSSDVLVNISALVRLKRPGLPWSSGRLTSPNG